jgi:SAM-dependent methyltransferase
MTVFNSLYASQYDQLYADKSYKSECDLIEEAVRRHATSSPRTLLDVGCGTGGHAVELSSRGYHVTGVDLSQPMLDCAIDKANSLDMTRRPSFLRGDARDFESGQTHDLAIMMFAVIGYMTSNDDVLKGLRNIRRQLKPGALFICDFWYGSSVLSVRPADRVRVLPIADGRVIRAARTTLDIQQQTADVTFKLWTLKGDRLVGETTETHLMRYFFAQEFALLLSVAGFRQVALSAFPSLDKSLSEDAWNALSIAQAV